MGHMSTSDITIETLGNAAPFDSTATVFDALVDYGLSPIPACSALVIERYGVVYRMTESDGQGNFEGFSPEEHLAPSLFTTQAEAEEYATRYKSARVVSLTARIEVVA